MNYAKIAGTGSYLPKQIVTNKALEQTLDTSEAWIIERTGIHQRHIANTHETAAFMGTQAAKKALEIANIDAVDLILVATTTPDAFFPSTACLIQAALKLPHCPAFDIAAACAGFNYALSVADQFIKTGQYRTVLVIGSEVMSRLLDWQDRSTCILFGDGAGAVVLTSSEEPGIIASHLQADGQYQELLHVNNMRAPDPGLLKMEGSAVFRHAVIKMSDTVHTLLESTHTSIQDIDWLIPHQANLRIMRALTKRLHLPEEKVVSTIHQHANTSSASVPLALDTAIRDGRVQRGQLLLLESFGGGFAWGSSLIRY
jgi:3-oxoacyl-[acyl-carrier-protein] synthase-3